MKVIEIIVAPDGGARVECQQASRFLETALGRRTDETLTAEFHATACDRNQISEAN